MSPTQKAGQRVIYGYRGLTPPEKLLALIRGGEAAGVIFFSDNISSEAQLRSTIGQLERANANPGNPVHAPLLLMIDQEGGTVRRLPGPPLLSEKRIGESADPEEAATTAGTDVGRYLDGIGLNVNLAPVLDVYRTAGDFDDTYGRSYSMDPSVVSRLGTDFIKAQQRQGVAAAAKHFPGLGAAAATQDTDQGPVTLDLSAEELRTIDERPFEAAAGARVKLVMVSWATYPALDPGIPAGLSSKIVDGELRRGLAFKGVTLSDGILADALNPYGAIGPRAVLAAKAGLDLIICAKLKSDVSVGVSAKNALLEAYVDGTLDESAFDDSVQRVIALRQSLGH